MSEVLEGLSYLGNGAYWAAFGVAVFMAVFVGLLPGVSATLVMALSISFIVLNIEDPLIGIVMLATLTGVDNTLDSIPAVLLGQPGGATQVTFLEGNQLARRGLAAHTLGAVYAVSAMGGLVGALALAIVIPVIKPFILAFGFPEIAAMALFGVAMVAALSSGAMVKGLAAAAFGPAAWHHRHRPHLCCAPVHVRIVAPVGRASADRNHHRTLRTPGDDRPDYDEAPGRYAWGGGQQPRGLPRCALRTNQVEHRHPERTLRCVSWAPCRA